MNLAFCFDDSPRELICKPALFVTEYAKTQHKGLDCVPHELVTSFMHSFA